MRFVHRLVIVAGFFLWFPTIAIVRDFHPGSEPPPATAEDFVRAAIYALLFVSALVYPIAWLFAGFDRSPK